MLYTTVCTKNYSHTSASGSNVSHTQSLLHFQIIQEAKQKLGAAVIATCHRFLSPAVRHISSTLRHCGCKPKFHTGLGCISAFLVCVVLRM